MSTKAQYAAKFIIFAVEQAHKAEAFGFPRNLCCRNLKIALHQYWQHEVMGQHGQAKKKNIPRSQAASRKSLSDCVVEHAVPQMEIVNWLMEMDPITELRVIRLLNKYFHVMLVTQKENTKLNASGLRSTMPEGWDRKDVYARYHAVGIRIATTKSPQTSRT